MSLDLIRAAVVTAVLAAAWLAAVPARSDGPAVPSAAGGVQTLPQCNDGIDNDGDGLVDFHNDPGCSQFNDPSERELFLPCDNGLDDDGDGLVDYPNDPGCDAPLDLDEKSVALACDDGLDNDGDGLIDLLEDRGCTSAADTSERGESAGVPSECDDGIDNDGDGLADFPADPVCGSPSGTTEFAVCQDGIDNDGDGLTDLPEDPGCTSVGDSSERGESAGVPSECDDGIDGDGDGLVDYPADPGCWGPRDRTETPPSAGSLDYNASLKIEIENTRLCSIGYTCPSTPNPVTLPIPGVGAALVNGGAVAGHLTNLGLGAGAFAIERYVVPLTDPFSAPILGVQITATNGAGAFSRAGGGAFGGVMPIRGIMKLCYFEACSSAVANLDIPLSVIGNGGMATFMAFETLTVIGAPWTTGTAAIGTNTVMGGVSPLSSTGAPSGHVTLVTPVFISTSLSSKPVYGPVFGILSLDFIPEPVALLLGGAAVASLVAVGCVRSRRAIPPHR